MCTAIRFTDSDGNLYFGRNLDWAYGYGETITFTPRNHPANTGHRAVLGMAIASEGFPLYFDCANERPGHRRSELPRLRLLPRRCAPGNHSRGPVRVPLVGHLELRQR